MENYLLESIDFDKITDKEIDWRLENEELLAIQYNPSLKYRSVLVNGRKIRNSSNARKGFMGLFNKKRQNERQKKFLENISNGNETNKIRVVSEGDSWFNYPTKLNEVIDHIFQDFSIFSLGYAGDWLSNIYKEQEYTEAIRLYKPDVFIISGGGNDLVGSNRLGTVLNKYQEGNTATELIRIDKLESILEDFRTIYKTIFTHLSQEHAELKIICHGYDYPYLDGKEKNWFGKPMKRKGIKDRGLRNEIGKYMMDRFNQMLEELSSEFNKVYYLDVRGVVPRNEWKDELHPNNNGFHKVANVFKNKINEISNS